MANNRSSITFDEDNLRSLPTTSSSTQETLDPEVEAQMAFEAEEERLHKQDWSKTTAAHESWGAREGRRSSVWSKIDDLASAPKQGGVERRGSILSTWAVGKDKDGHDILSHGFEHDEDAIDDSADGSVNGLTKVISKNSDAERRASANRGQERRGSILSLWSGGKDADGKSVVLHDDEEWKV